MLAEHGYDTIEVSQGLQYAELDGNLGGLPLRLHILKPVILTGGTAMKLRQISLKVALPIW